MKDGVFVTGMGVHCSVADNVGQFADALRRGRSGIDFIDEQDGFRRGVGIGALVKAFSLSDKLSQQDFLTQELCDSISKCALRSPAAIQSGVYTTAQAWVDADLHQRGVDAENIGLVVSCDNSVQQYQYDSFLKYQKTPEYLSPRYALHALETDHVGTISEIFGIRGEGFTVGGASAGGNVALIKALQLLQLELVDVCVVVAPLTALSPVAMQGFHNLGAVGGKKFAEFPDQACRPFDRDHEGFIYGQGSASLILESEKSVFSRGLKATTQLLSGKLNLDGNRLSNPNKAGEVEAMRCCLSMAGISTWQVDYINTHGTSTPLGDEIELEAIKAVFGESEKMPWLNSTKGLIGHCLFSAGLIEAVATVIQMQEQFIHPNLNLRNKIDKECRFASDVASELKISYAISNSFGFGGINSSILFKHGESHAV